MANLFDPLTLRGRTLRNRVVVSPMCQYSSTDGFATDWHLVHLGQFAVGGAALVLNEATGVSPEGRITHGCLGIWKDDQLEMLSRIVRFVQSQGALMGIQLAHAGRKASTQIPWKGIGKVPDDQHPWTPVAPSAVAFDASYPMPVALDEAGIAKVISDFAAAARRARAANYDVIELHAAHGYLIHEFLSPLSNQRTDRWGGSLENRTRLACEVAKAVRAEWPEDRPLFARISSTDWTEGGWDIEQSVVLAQKLSALGVDLIDASSGGNVATAKIPVGPGYQVRFAERIRRDAKVKTGAVGLITEPAQAQSIIADGQADLVLLARELLRDPHFAQRAAHQLKQSAPWPVQYERARLK